MTVVNNSAPRTHPNDKLRYIPKSGMSRDHTRTGSRRSRCLGGVAEVRPCETGCLNPSNVSHTWMDAKKMPSQQVLPDLISTSSPGPLRKDAKGS